MSRRGDAMVPQCYRVEGFEGRPHTAQLIAQAVLSDRVAHAYLLVGPRGVGKRRAALSLGRLAACHGPTLNNGEVAPCGNCPSCRLPFTPDHHHDVILVDPRAQETLTPVDGHGAARQVSTMDRIREAQALVALKPIVGRRKCLVLPRVDSLQVVQMSTLLKTIEEPPAQGLVLLTAENPSALLPTIVSRCQIVTMPPLPTDHLLGELGRDDDQAIWAARLAGGRPEVMRLLLEAPEATSITEGLAEMCRLAFSTDPLDSLRAADLCRSLCVCWYDAVEAKLSPSEPAPSDEDKVRQAADSVLFALEGWIRDRLALAVGARVTPMSPVPTGSATPEPRSAGEALRLLSATKRAMSSNASTRLALEALFLELGAGG